MDTNLLDIKFARIGARLKVADRPSRRSRTPGVISLDVQADHKGEFFEIVRQPGAEAEIAVLDVQPADRHLLLLVREGKDKSKYLCGHDERHWFVAGIPESAPVGTVRQAKEALKPAEVQTAQAGKRLRAKARNRRKNAAFVRQGEWFFLPIPGFVVDEKLVLLNEPLRLDGAWVTSTVTALASAIYDERAFDRLPILTDALEDAGCNNTDILNHCRQPGLHTRGCWVVDRLLGKG